MYFGRQNVKKTKQDISDRRLKEEEISEVERIGDLHVPFGIEGEGRRGSLVRKNLY